MINSFPSNFIKRKWNRGICNDKKLSRCMKNISNLKVITGCWKTFPSPSPPPPIRIQQQYVMSPWSSYYFDW